MIKRILLSDFRGFGNRGFDLRKGIKVVIGKNGRGKREVVKWLGGSLEGGDELVGKK